MPASKPSMLLRESDISRLDNIKRIVIKALFADDELMDILVLKGGTALDIVHQVSGRSSIDIDLSISDDLPYPIEAIRDRIARSLEREFERTDYHVFDVTMEAKPKEISLEFEGFWGGYRVWFKLIHKDKVAELKNNMDSMRRNVIVFGSKGRFKIDISKFEYCDSKARWNIDGYTIYVYTPEMIVAEKLRAICQQTSAYTESMQNQRSLRSRDFVDIYAVVSHFGLNMCEESNVEILRYMFEAKRVPLKLLGELEGEREFHRPDFDSVKNTMRTTDTLQTYDYYFDFVIDLVEPLKPIWNE